MTLPNEEAEKMYTKAIADVNKEDDVAVSFVYENVKVDYVKAHREDTAKKQQRKREKKRTRARNRQRSEKRKKEERQKKKADLQQEASQRMEDKKAKRAEKVVLERNPARKELRRLNHVRIRSFSVD